MPIAHDSRDLNFRNPYGAVAVSEPVRLAIHAAPDGEEVRNVTLCYAYGLYQFHESRSRMLADPSSAGFFAVTVRMPADPGLFFYWFEVETNTHIHYVTSDRHSAKGGCLLSPCRPRYLPGEAHTPSAFRITVHEAGITVPDWYTGALVYQIFPDRFNRDNAFTPLRFARDLKRQERLFHADWHDDVDFKGRPETGYMACDFYGGSLEGIREKLDYLAGLGVEVIYLNPIFQSRSNHRYDTGDYEQVDPLLGTVEDFRRLCADAKKRGIRIILDGVFNHTGADSRYFNKYDRYPETGAYQDITGHGHSPYRNWYSFHQENGTLYYDAWWGFQELPTVSEQNLTYQDYILGQDGIVRRWLRNGASGWRLDVSDELPDSFLRHIRNAAKSEKSDAVILGEVWEDASAKISYGTYRDFLFGRTHDCVMGYPFRQSAIGFLSGCSPAETMLQELESVREHYPQPYLYSNLNLVSSHDAPRAITVLAGQPDPGSRDAQARLKLPPAARERGQRLLLLLFFLQLTYPGTPCLYYGDETAMEGYRDPFNRRTYPWGQENQVLIDHFRRLAALRRKYPVLRTGLYRPLLADCHLFVFERTLNGDRDFLNRPCTGPSRILIAINRDNAPHTCAVDGQTVTIPRQNGILIIDGHQTPAIEGKIPVV